MKKNLAWLERNMMSVASILFAVATLLAGVQGLLPAKDAANATAAVLALTAVARALVHAAKELKR